MQRSVPLDENIPEYITTGSVAKCVDCFDEVTVGEVAGFDRGVNMILLKTDQADGKTKVTFINLGFVKEFELLKEMPSSTEQSSVTQNVNASKIAKRIEEETERKYRSLCPSTCGIDGRRLFVVIRKTIEDVRWSDDSIEVFQCVLVHPPYTAQSVQIKSTHEGVTQAQSTLEHVKKIVSNFVDKFWRGKETASPDHKGRCAASSEVQSTPKNG
ncbi:protein LSM12 [Trichuris trichiura]|uniref:Protein LSM12 n=1 Tax=Trichuris trichiura TaxID=36087 RepID=A0A077Z9I8_TRITR|nr:protein LSM12 [Trichuris trichiura]